MNINRKRPSTLDLYINDMNRYNNKEADTAFDKYKDRCKELMILPVPLGLKYNKTQPRDIIAFLEVNFCPPEMLNLEPLVLSYAIE